MKTEASDSGHERLCPSAMVAIFGAAAALRIGYGVYRCATAADPLSLTFPDEVDYWTIAQNLHDGHGLIDPMGLRAARMPLYPAFLSLFTTFERGVLYAKAAQHLIGALAAVFIAILTNRIAGRRAGILAGLVVACDPFLIFFSSFLLTETLFITALLALWTAGILLRFPSSASQLQSDSPSDGRPPDRARGSAIHWCIIGTLAAICVLIRESSLLLVLAWIAFLACWTRSNAASSNRRRAREGIPANEGARLDSRTSSVDGRSAAANRESEIRNPKSEIRNWLGTAFAAIMVVAALFPWALRNRSALGEFVWLTTRGGVSLYDGVGPQATGRSDLADVYRRPELRGLSEVEWDRWFRRAAWDAFRSDPGRVARLAVPKVIRTWSPLPNADEYQSALIRLISAAWTIPTWTLALIGLWTLRRRPAICLALVMPALYFTALHALFVGSVRYRLPALAITAVLTGVGAHAFWQRIRRGRKNGPPRAANSLGT